MSKHKAFKKLTQRCDWSTESREGGKTVGHEDEATSPIPSAWGGSEGTRVFHCGQEGKRKL